MVTKKDKQEFLENRTSWKWFERKFEDRRKKLDINSSDESLILLEILKELQFMNNKK